MARFATLTLSQGESPSLYKNAIEDNTLKADTDGGYEFRRRRTTRAPRRMIETGFLNMPHADYELLEAFYLTRTNVDVWVWFDYLRGVNRTVRFDSFEPDYVGIGTNRKWTVKIKMSEL